jgi:nucleoside-diphosphate-sugar epimerase
MANILIIGGTGCVGQETASALLRQKQHQIVNFSRGQTASSSDSEMVHHQGDILDLDSITAALKKHAITHILHTAALRTSESKSHPHRAIDINVNGTANVLEAIRRYGKVERLVFLSTAAVYDIPPNNQFAKESTNTVPLNAYTATKLAAEQLVECYSNNYGIPSTILRPQIIYGLSRGADGSTAGVSSAIRAAVKTEAFEIPFGGTTGFHYAPNIGTNTALALLSSTKHFAAYNPPCESLSLEKITATINTAFPESQISHAQTVYPFPAGLDDTRFKMDFPEFAFTPFQRAVSIMKSELP